MNSSFDKIVPGLQNKLHLLVDLSLATLGILLCAHLNPAHHGLQVLILSLVAWGAWLFAAVVTRLYSPWTPRRLWDNLTLRAFGVLAAMFSIQTLMRLVPLAEQHLDAPTFVVFFFCSSAIGRMLVFKPLARFSKPVHEVLIVGTGHLGFTTYENLTQAQRDYRAC
ncbi:MAG: hypothetical protein EOO40_08405, partial [Deltaproteobacteria bacterium]